MLALLIEDVTLLRAEDKLRVHVRFRAGATQTLKLPLPQKAWQSRATMPEVLAAVDELLNDHPDHEVAQILNQRELLSGAEQAFTTNAVQWVRYRHSLKSYKLRLQEKGYLTATELRKLLGVGRDQLLRWRHQGLLDGRACNAKNEWLYQVPEPGSLPGQRCGAGELNNVRKKRSPHKLGEVQYG